MAEPTTPLDLDAIRAREQAATKGPWTAEDWDVAVCTSDGRQLVQLAEVLLGDWDTRENHPQAAADAEFIAHTRQDVPALLAEVERLRAHSITLNSISYRIAEALDEHKGQESYAGNPAEQAERLIADRDDYAARLRATDDAYRQQCEKLCAAEAEVERLRADMRAFAWSVLLSRGPLTDATPVPSVDGTEPNRG